MKLTLIILAAALCEARPRVLEMIAHATIGTSYIINGEDADIADYPYQCSLRFGGSHTCGCSILDTTSVLTAAHCVEGRTAGSFSVQAGSTDRTDNSTVINIDDYRMHPDYESNVPGYPNDIATMTLNSGLDLTNPNIAAAILPVDNDNTFAGDNCILTGWGRTGTSDEVFPVTLQMVAMYIEDNPQCVIDLDGVLGVSINDGHICATRYEYGACNGDSGGPMTASNGMVVGVGSWGIYSGGNCIVTYPSVYTRTSYFLGFINTRP